MEYNGDNGLDEAGRTVDGRRRLQRPIKACYFLRVAFSNRRFGAHKTPVIYVLHCLELTHFKNKSRLLKIRNCVGPFRLHPILVIFFLLCQFINSSQCMAERLRRITVYETASRFYIVGCDPSGTRFHVLKIDRVDSRVLLTGEAGPSYTKDEILELLATISEGNSVVIRSVPGSTKKSPGKGLIERVSNAYGILGAVRFLEGYYLIVITKANVVATFGYHSIHKIAEVAMISITMDGVSTSSEEQKYVRQFQSVDLSTDFYFSYTYDLSRTMQENALSTDWNQNGQRNIVSDKKFVWNTYLLEPLRSNLVHERWFVEVVHGYVNQQYLELPLTKLSLTLIGRRSAEYAGTRYLKRGANLKGSVANDVETEQILWDTLSCPGFSKGRFSSYVQRRGSVPLRWSQDPSTRGVVGKPLILIDIHEPHAQTAGAHFRDLRKKYGNPIIAMNLVKRREKRRHENLLHERFIQAIHYLNQFLPPDEKICYMSFDVARCNKGSTITSNVLTKLDEIAVKAVLKQGWFQSFPMPHRDRCLPRNSISDFAPLTSDDGRFLLQKGICRANCVDCLDRTNVAQFAIAKVALGCQLFALGVVDEPALSIHSEVCRIFEEMFDEHGDTLAWQYAGSQLVHSIKHYKKTSAFQERSRDVIQTLSRYYSNTFGDYDKQAAINLFLGMFRPQISSTQHLWDLQSDYYLHFPTTFQVRTNYCGWMFDEEELEEYIMVNYEDCWEKDKEPKTSISQSGVVKLSNEDDFRNYYRTFEMTTLEPKVKQQVILNQRALQVTGVNQEISVSGQFLKLFKSESKDSKSKSKIVKEEDDDDDEYDDEQKGEDVLEAEEPWYQLVGRREEKTATRKDKDTKHGHPTLSTGLKFAKEIYGLQRTSPGQNDRQLYEKYVDRGGFTVEPEDWLKYKPTIVDRSLASSKPELWRTSIFTADNCFQSAEPELSKSSLSFYAKSCNYEKHEPSKVDLAVFAQYPLL